MPAVASQLIPRPPIAIPNMVRHPEIKLTTFERFPILTILLLLFSHYRQSYTKVPLQQPDRLQNHHQEGVQGERDLI